MTTNVSFLAATYNEEAEIVDLLNSVSKLADFFVISDDGSTDKTVELAEEWALKNEKSLYMIRNPHIGLPETVKKVGIELIKVISPDAWVIMLDADERIPEELHDLIKSFLSSNLSNEVTHVWFNMAELIDGVQTRSFLKCRMFKASSIRFSESVHEDDTFDGDGINFNWLVIHRKTKDKQIMREKQYLETYQKLLDEGKVTQEWVDRCIGFHYFVKE